MGKVLDGTFIINNGDPTRPPQTEFYTVDKPSYKSYNEDRPTRNGIKAVISLPAEASAQAGHQQPL
jgi:hypothetical protein